LRDGFDATAVGGDVAEHGRGRDVVVPDPVMQRLEVPHALAGLCVETDDRFSEEIVPGTSASVVVARRFFERKIDVAEFLVRAEQRPCAAVA
jgi:hypothetical protein